MKNDNSLGLDEPASTLKTLNVAQIRESDSALRSVQRDSEDYAGLVDSVREHGVLKPILVREATDPETQETFYWLIDGLQRFNACKDSGRRFIDTKVVSMSDAEALFAQIITNIHNIETKPVEYSGQLVRILAGNPTMTVGELAAKLARGISWVSDRLGLLKLTKEIGTLVDDGKINLTSAYALAKIPVEEQTAFVDRALTLQPQEFVPLVNARKKELDEARRQGRKAGAAVFVPMPHLQKISDLKTELESATIANVLVNRTNTTNPVEAFTLGVAWALHLDPISKETAIANEAARVQKQADEKAKRKAESEAKKKEALLAPAAG